MWNDWAADDPPGLYVAPMMDMVTYLARSQVGRVGSKVGQPLAFELDEHLHDAIATLKTPKYPQSDLISLTGTAKFNQLIARMLAGAEILKPTKPQAAQALQMAAQKAKQAFMGQNLAAASEAIKDAQQILNTTKDSSLITKRLLHTCDGNCGTNGQTRQEFIHYNWKFQAALTGQSFSPETPIRLTVI